MRKQTTSPKTKSCGCSTEYRGATCNDHAHLCYDIECPDCGKELRVFIDEAEEDAGGPALELAIEEAVGWVWTNDNAWCENCYYEAIREYRYR